MRHAHCQQDWLLPWSAPATAHSELAMLAVPPYAHMCMWADSGCAFMSAILLAM